MSNMESSTTTTLAQSEGSVHDVSHQSGANAGQSSSLSSQAPAHQGELFFSYGYFKLFVLILIMI